MCSNMASAVLETAKSNGFDFHDEAFARFLDEQDELKSCRSEFHYPKNKTLPLGKRRFPHHIVVLTGG